MDKGMDKGISRRGFVAAGAAGMAGALAAAGMAGAASAAEAAEAAEGQPGEAEPSEAVGSVAPIEPVSAPASWDEEADLVVVGAGGGGLNAAVRARELGLSVIVVEKCDAVGGNTQNATMFTGVNNTAAQNEAGFAIPSYPFDEAAWVDYIERGYGFGADPEMLGVIARNMPVVFDWMTEEYGIQWTLAGGGSFYQDSTRAIGMTNIVNAAYARGQELGAEYLLGTEAEALVMQDGRVVGVKALAADGTEVYLRGEKGVLLTGGGFAANRDLLAEYCPSALKRAAACYLVGIDTGECFRMGLGAGAAACAPNSFCMFDGGLDWFQKGGEWCHYLYDGATQIVRQPWLSLKRDGSRVRYIDSKQLGALTNQGMVETCDEDWRTRIVFDANWDSYIAGADNYLAGFAQFACRQPIQEGVARAPYVPEYYQDYHAGFQDAVDAGLIVKADTLEELAGLIDMDADVLAGAVARWNEACERGEDDFAYPVPAQWLRPVDTPPFYGAKIGGFLFMTCAGLKINTSMQVLAESGKPVPGLYAGWYTAGGPNGADTVVSMTYDFGGVSKSYLGGYLAAEAVAALE